MTTFGGLFYWPSKEKKTIIFVRGKRANNAASCEMGVRMTDSLPPLCPPLQTSPPWHGTTCHPLWTEQHKAGQETLMLHHPVQTTGLRLYRTSPKGFPWYLSKYGPLEQQKFKKYVAKTKKEAGFTYSQPDKLDMTQSNTKWDLWKNLRGCTFLARYSLAWIKIFRCDWLH